MRTPSNKYLCLQLISLLTLFQILPVAAQTSTRDGQTKGASQSAASAAVPQVTFEKSSQPDALQGMLHVERQWPVLHVDQWYGVGSKNERGGRTGFALLFQHMMFQGAKNDLNEYVE